MPSLFVSLLTAATTPPHETTIEQSASRAPRKALTYANLGPISLLSARLLSFHIVGRMWRGDVALDNVGSAGEPASTYTDDTDDAASVTHAAGDSSNTATCVVAARRAVAVCGCVAR